MKLTAKACSIIVLGLLGLACNKQKSKPEEESKHTLELGYLYNIHEISGCSCTLSDNPAAGNGSILFAFSYDNPALIEINHCKEVLLTQAKNKSVADNTIEKTFQNEKYRVSVRIANKNQTGDEVWAYEGQLIVEDKTTQDRVEKKVYGECGC